MSSTGKSVRQSISLPEHVARRVKSLAATGRTSTSRVMVELIESGLAAQEQEKKRFFDVADRLSRAKDPKERKRLKEELARMTFGDFRA
jgi:metal-responsive CopG/Arc/MetJ family transcriptional regulator